MTLKTEHKRIKDSISNSVIEGMHCCEDPFEATDTLSEWGVKKACAIIDRMIPIAGVLIFAIVKTKAKETNKQFYKSVVERAEKLNLQVTKGFNHAQKETLRLTGIFPV